MPFILSFAHMGRDSIKEVGGKGANLGEMVKAGLPVPPGFVVTIDAYMKFVKANNLEEDITTELAKVNVDNIELLNKTAEKIRKFILESRIPDVVERDIREAYFQMSLGREAKGLSGPALDRVKAGRENAIVAVRSSATSEDLADASFAGQLESILSVQGERKLYDAIKQCWASLFTPRVIFYRKTKGFTDFPKMGVIVQRMIQSEKAGVMFTANPMNNDASQMVIESSWGYGESIVSGLVTPDEYVLNKANGDTIAKRISAKKWLRRLDTLTGNVIKEDVEAGKVNAEVLTGAELRKLWELGRRDEEYYGGKPQDIEWCIENNRAYLVQTRAITTLGARTIKHGGQPEGHAIVTGLGASPGNVKGRVKLAPDADAVKDLTYGEILVTTMTNPSMVPLMRKAVAIVTDEGGSTCHAAIVSRELGVPCIVGTGNATQVLKQGQDIVVDATNGKVYDAANVPGEFASSAPIATSSTTTMPVMDTMAGLASFSELPVVQTEVPSSSAASTEPYQVSKTETPETDRLTATSIKANIAFPEAAERAAPKADGVGLLRAEHMLASSGKHPVMLARNDPEELVRTIENGIGAIARVFHPRPVWYRTLDARTDEFRGMQGGENEPHESNPMLGWHGIRRSVDESDVFRCELHAIRNLQLKGLDNVCIMLPFIINVEELRKAKSMIDFPVRVGIMVETPAAVAEIESFCKEGIAFASIGSNDLTQLTLGVDRNNAKIAGLYTEFHPAVISFIKSTIRTCRQHGVEVSLCGESGSNPRMAEILVEAGIDSISVEVDAIDAIRQVAARTERKILLRKVRD